MKKVFICILTIYLLFQSPVNSHGDSAELVAEKLFQDIRKKCSDSNDKAESYAEKALVRIEDPKIAELLINKLIQDFGAEYSSVADTAADTLIRIANSKMIRGKFKDLRIVESLVTNLNNDSEYFRATLARCLGGIRDSRVVNILVGMLRDESSWVRRWAILGLGYTDSQSQIVVNALIKVLEGDDSFERRTEAAEVLGKIGNKEAIDPLLNFLKLFSNISAPRFIHGSAPIPTVLKALRKFEEPRVVMPLLYAIEHRLEIRGSVDSLFEGRYSTWLSHIVNIGDKGIEQLFSALNSKNDTIRMIASWTIVDHEITKGIAKLISGIEKNDLSITTGAYRFLISRGQAGTEDILIKAFEKYENRIMIIDFLNSMNSQLREYAIRWANSHGFEVRNYSTNKKSLEWGEQK